MAEEHVAPIFFAPFVSSPMRIEPAWIDAYGRLPLAYHHLLFERAIEEAFFVLGLDPAGEARASALPAESRTAHKRDLRPGDQVRVTLQLIDHDGEHLHLYLEMRHAAEGWTATACEVLAIHADLATRRMEPFPIPVQRNLAAMKATHSRLGRPAIARGALGIPRPDVGPREPVLAAGTRH